MDEQLGQAPPPPTLPAPALQAGMEYVPSSAPPGYSALPGCDGGPTTTTEKFSTGLCECCEGPGACTACFISYCLPCWAHGIVGDVTGGGVGRAPPCALTGMLWSGAQIGGILNMLQMCGPYASIVSLPFSIGFITLGALGRTKMREKYGIPGSTCPGDCCTAFFCFSCAYAQQIRHIRDNTPGQHLELWRMTGPTRADESFLDRSCAPYR